MARKIPLKTISFENQEQVSYSELCLLVLKTHPRGTGFTPAEMADAINAMKPFKETSADHPYVVLEDSQWRTLRDHMEGFRFAFADEQILEFCEDIRHAESVKLNP